jgi:hypothetical protein
MAKPLPVRVVLESKGAKRKFFKLFADRDNSIYIRPDRPPGQPWRIPGGPEQDAQGRIHLDFQNFKSPSFDLNKISYHKSGYIHLTDRSGKRYRDGTRGPAFSEMELPYDLCILVPCNPDLLPPHTKNRDAVF